jgi:hypothetical protein
MVRTVREMWAILKRTSCYPGTARAVCNSRDARRVAFKPEKSFSRRDINNRHMIVVYHSGRQSLTFRVNRDTVDRAIYRKRKLHRGPLRVPFVQDFGYPGESAIIVSVDGR